MSTTSRDSFSAVVIDYAEDLFRKQALLEFDKKYQGMEYDLTKVKERFQALEDLRIKFQAVQEAYLLGRFLHVRDASQHFCSLLGQTEGEKELKQLLAIALKLAEQKVLSAEG
jgi:hypothetical protein